MRHTYLLQAGRWRASGSFTNENGESLAVTGESVITHGEDSWRVEGTMTLSTDQEVSFHNDYDVVPFANGGESTAWKSENPVLGTLSGNFVIIGDRILSAYQSRDGTHRGAECLWRIDDENYGGVGALFRGDQRVSSWEVRLTREPG
jgi:hypothetical protein